MGSKFSDNFDIDKIFEKYHMQPSWLQLLIAKFTKKSVIFHLPDCVIEYNTKDDRCVYTPKPNCQNIYPRTVSRRVVTWSNSERSSQCLPTMLARYSHTTGATFVVWSNENNDDITNDVVRWMSERGITYENFTEEDHLALKLHWNNLQT